MRGPRITKEQAGMVAVLVQSVRSGWDTRAIVAAIGEVSHRDVAEIAYAAVKCAQNPANLSPKALTFEGEHWKFTPTAGPPPTTDRTALLTAIERCPDCDDQGQLPNGWLCLHDPEAPARARRGRELAQAALEAVRVFQQPEGGIAA